MSRQEATVERARRVAVRAQLLDGSATSVLETVRRLGFLQMDPIATVAVPQQLVLFAEGPAGRAIRHGTRTKPSMRRRAVRYTVTRSA